MTNILIKRYSNLVVACKMHIKVKVRYDFTLNKLLAIDV